MRLSVPDAARLPYKEYQRALMIAQAEAEAPTHRTVTQSMNKESIH